MKVLLTLAIMLCALTNVAAQEITFSTPCETVEFCVDTIECEPITVNLLAEATTSCNFGSVDISYSIDLYDNGIIDVSGSGNLIDDTFPIGAHRVIFTASDDCDNQEVCDYLFLVSDCTLPLVWADSFLMGETMENCIFELFATEVDNGSFDNCGLANMLIVSPSQGLGQTEPPASASESWEFNICSDGGTNTLDLWVSDDAGNWSYDIGYILITDNQAPFCSCPPPYLCIESLTEDDQNIGEVSYLIEEGAPWNYEYTVLGDDCIEYSLQTITTITPSKDDSYINGVSTFDLILISRHLLGIESLDSPYKLIAADVNNSGTISTFDLIQIRRLLLGLTDEFPNNTSWRFVDSDFVFQNPQNPWETPFPESVSFEDYLWFLGFTGIKTGDVNGSASPGVVSNPESEQRKEFGFEIADQFFEQGEVVTIDFYTKDITQCFGFQFGLDYNGEFLRFEKMNRGSLKYLTEDNLSVKNEEGTLSISWINQDFEQVEKANSPLFSFQFKALQSGRLQDVFEKLRTGLAPEVYTNELNILDLKIQFSRAVSEYDFNITAQPNPFQNETIIQFDLPKKDEVLLKILDTKGRIIKTITADFEKGFNQIKLEKETFLSSGVYFYEIETSTDIKAGKLLKL